MNWRRFLQRQKADAEQREELDFYLDVTTEEYIGRGMEQAAAREAAQRKLGNTTLIREEVYRMNTLTFAEGVLRDVRHALRMVRRNPGFSAAAILSLALGIGANTAMFSVLSAVLIRPLPYPGSDALVGVSNLLVIQGQVFEDADLSPAMYAACKENARAFESFGVWTVGAATVTGLGDPEQLVTVTATQGVLPALGVQAHIGRWFSSKDDSPGTPETVILSYGYWQRKFGGDPGAVGRTVLVDFVPRQVDWSDASRVSSRQGLPGHYLAAALSRERAQGGVQLCGHREAQARRNGGPGESGCGACVEGLGGNGRVQQNARRAPGPTQPAPVEKGRGGGHWSGTHTSYGSARTGAAAGLRQRGEPCACAGAIAAAGVCDSRRAGRGLGKDRARSPGGESDVGHPGRRPRSGVCVRRSASVGDTGACEPSAARGDIPRRNGAGVRVGVLGRVEHAVRVGGGAPVR